MADDKARLGEEREIELDKISDEVNSIDRDQKDFQPSESESEPERKITQTDHLNKKLLSAFLDRLNTVDNSVAFGLQSSTQQQCSGQTDSDEQDFKNWNISCCCWKLSFCQVLQVNIDAWFI